MHYCSLHVQTEGKSETEPADSEEENTASEENKPKDEESDESDAEDTEENETPSEETNDDDSEDTYEKEEQALDEYSSEEIEYARVWRQLGPNQDIEELSVQHIPAGTPLNPDEEISLDYPEDVVQLRGSRLVDGEGVIYSGNGDGTINVYDVPIRWYGGLSRPDHLDDDAIREDMEDMINNTEEVYVEPGNDEEIINIIEKINMQ
ncbi:hypothetical protein GCM10010954_21390 [Halobacillus andaensis]|uniref:Uncharacterized protein n=1 Tax=Halobacillus andaensis TaxID=1176239 RepID=A0A917EYD6_HALAA|nr:hypothetical protein [Halobacillus andaensis]MBP2004354.1 hypothetical protein [Halobacillus andaensis]GGF22283.1 hypothetical protein GCM10010954_21390 [Halobacillus andaensis]